MSLAVIIKCSDCNSSHNTSWRSVQQHAGSMNWCRRLCTAARNSQGNCMSHVKTPLYNVEWAACDIFSFLGTWTHVCYLCEFANFLWFISVWPLQVHNWEVFDSSSGQLFDVFKTSTPPLNVRPATENKQIGVHATIQLKSREVLWPFMSIVSSELHVCDNLLTWWPKLQVWS